ncbi:TonB-dependent receptor [uncultured Novosphingobium sp.]|uniref:TonB-dependent receptor n=1 Tax=uncultured Novosphingobium sp. TaxID=292277 RepID=UPI002585F761|nr:TonB-dependent receptor [uncultured Novosphingobium sp.]
MKVSSCRVIGASVFATAVALMASPVIAAEDQQPADGTGFGDIIVTARKTGEAAQSLPITVAAFGGKEIQDRAILTVQDLQTITPGLTISNNATGGVPVFAIRGTATELGIDGGVALYLNDVPLMSAVGITTQFYDISTVEVLKGPQGTQFGTNTTGGTITVRTNLPTDKVEAFAKAGYGNYNRRDFEGMINLPVNDVLAFRFAGNYIKRDGYVKNRIAAGGAPKDFSDENRYSLRGTMSLNSGPIETALILDYFQRDESPTAFIPVAFRPNAGQGINLANLGALTGSRKSIFVGADPSGVAKDLYGKAKLFGLEHRATIELSDAFSIRNVLGYRHDKTETSEESSGTSFALVNVLNDVKTSQWTDDITLRHKALDGRLRTSLGGYFLLNDKRQGQNATVAQSIYLTFFNAPLVSNALNFEKKQFTSKAAYFNSEFDITDTLNISGGVRYNWDHVKSEGTVAQADGVLPRFGKFFRPDARTPCNTAAFLAYTDRDLNACVGRRSKSFRAPSWTVALSNKFSSRVLGYAKISHGYLAGGANFTIREVPFYEPEKTTMIEAGVKADWSLGGRPLRTNVALYRGKTSNKQIFVNVNYDDQFSGFGVINAAKQEVYGADFEMRYSPIQGLTFDGSYNYIHSEFKSFIIPGLGGNADGLTGATLVPRSDLSGAVPAQTPKHQFNVAATYELPIDPSSGKITTTISGYYSSKIKQNNLFVGYNASFGPQYNEINSYFTASASLNWENVAGSPISAQFWVRNLFDKNYITARQAQFQAFGYATAVYGAPRTFGGSASIKF